MNRFLLFVVVVSVASSVLIGLNHFVWVNQKELRDEIAQLTHQIQQLRTQLRSLTHDNNSSDQCNNTGNVSRTSNLSKRYDAILTHHIHCTSLHSITPPRRDNSNTSGAVSMLGQEKETQFWQQIRHYEELHRRIMNGIIKYNALAYITHTPQHTYIIITHTIHSNTHNTHPYMLRALSQVVHLRDLLNAFSLMVMEISSKCVISSLCLSLSQSFSPYLFLVSRSLPPLCLLSPSFFVVCFFYSCLF